MDVRTYLQSHPEATVIVKPEDSVAATARALAASNKGLALVCGAGKELIGLVSVMDISRAVGVEGAAAPELPVQRIMTSDYCACQPENSLESALELMRARRVRHLPVVEDGRLEGLVNLRSLLDFLYRGAEMEAADLRGFAFGLGYH